MNRRTVAFPITTIALLAGAVLAAQSGSMSSWQLDPPLLLGGRDGDAAVAVASDGAGNTYVVGLTSSLDFPTRLPFFRPASATPFSQWGFLTKLDARYQITYSTYLDGIPSAVAVGADGTAVVVGMASYEDQRPWIVKVDASGAHLLFAIKLDTTASAGKCSAAQVVLPDAPGPTSTTTHGSGSVSTAPSFPAAAARTAADAAAATAGRRRPDRCPSHRGTSTR